MTVQMSFVVQPTIHTSSLGVWCTSLPSHAFKISSRESQDLGGDHTLHLGLFSAAYGDLAQLCHKGPGPSIDHTVDGEDLIHPWERLISLH